MKNVFNWFFGSFFRSLGRFISFLFILLVLSIILAKLNINLPFMSIMNVSAEDFNQSERFQYWVYQNTDTQIYSGTGFTDIQTSTPVNRIQWLYNNYTYDPNFLYDITFTYYFDYYDSTQSISPDLWADTCQIYTGAGPYYTCTLNKSFDYDKHKGYIQISIYNMQGTGQSSTWLNVYSNYNDKVQLFAYQYKLTINKKENPNATSDDINNATQNIINNQNNNTQQIINSQNNINNSLNDDNYNEEEVKNDLDSLVPEDTTSSSFSDFLLLPLNWIQQLLNTENSCSPINLPLPFIDKVLTLPCMDSFWNKMGFLKTLMEMVWIGIVGVRIFNGLFLLVEDIKDPNPDKDMTRLKSWEL